MSSCESDYADIDNALLDAIARGDLSGVQYLVEKCGVDVHASDNCALRISAERGYLQLVRYLVEHDADIHADNDAPLRYAVKKDHPHIVRYLVTHGANVHVDNDFVLRYNLSVQIYDVMKRRIRLMERDVQASIVRFLQRVSFTDYMDTPEFANIMALSHVHHAALLQTFHRAMGRKVAMDVQHVVVEMLVGRSVMTYFRSK